MSSVLNEEKIRATTGGLTLEDIFQETDYLQTVVIILSTSQEKDFLARYTTLVNTEKAIPVQIVLPKSARKLLVDAEGYVVYSVVILKKFLAEMQHACRENRFTLRTFKLSEVRNVNGDGEGDSEEEVLARYEAIEKKVKVSDDFFKFSMMIMIRWKFHSGVCRTILNWQVHGFI